jgi:hypothetical protein
MQPGTDNTTFQRTNDNSLTDQEYGILKEPILSHLGPSLIGVSNAVAVLFLFQHLYSG